VFELLRFELNLSSDWDDISSAHTFMSSPIYEEFIGVGSKIFDFSSSPYLFHANYVSHPPNGPRDALITEYATFVLPAAASGEQKSALEDATLNLCTYAVNERGCQSFATGWIVEDIKHDQGTAEKAVGLSALLGWESVEAHMRNRDDEGFMALIKTVRGLALTPTTGYTGTTMFHAKLRKD